MDFLTDYKKDASEDVYRVDWRMSFVHPDRSSLCNH